ncbi:MAG: disulfide bond formation protein B [Candidatus Magasanikbacteria bacterium]|nr:disulfide bond formation protein B [Candidatus Magasanikbacteria bacterium]
MDIYNTAVTVLSVGTILAQVFIVLVLIFIFVPPLHKQKQVKKFLKFLKERSFLLAFGVALSSIVGSLFFSDVASLLPCELCWKQRILMFPQSLLFGLAVWKKEKVIADYSTLLSAIGILYSIYHYTLQMLPRDITTCDTSSFLSSCSEKLIFEFGYITIPMMTATAFALLLLFMLIHKKLK